MKRFSYAKSMEISEEIEIKPLTKEVLFVDILTVINILESQSKNVNNLRKFRNNFCAKGVAKHMSEIIVLLLDSRFRNVYF